MLPYSLSSFQFQLKWKCKKDDETNGGYSQDVLFKLLQKVYFCDVTLFSLSVLSFLYSWMLYKIFGVIIIVTITLHHCVEVFKCVKCLIEWWHFGNESFLSHIFINSVHHRITCWNIQIQSTLVFKFSTDNSSVKLFKNKRPAESSHIWSLYDISVVLFFPLNEGY